MAKSHPTRAERISQALARLESDGIIRSAFSYSPGDSRGRRWIVTARGFRGERSYSTAEVEAFLHGVDAALDR